MKRVVILAGGSYDSARVVGAVQASDLRVAHVTEVTLSGNIDDPKMSVN